MPASAYLGKDLVGLAELSRDQIRAILDTAEPFKEISERAIKKVPVLRGKTIVNLFFEASTRTLASFELAGKRLGADVVNFSAGNASIKKGESLADTAETLAAMRPDLLVVRHSSPGAAKFFSELTGVSTVNAGDGAHEHPTQGLLDVFTLTRRWGEIGGRRIAIVGDIRHSRVARSGAHALIRMGAQVTLVGPPTLIPPEASSWGAEVSHELDSVLPKLDVCYMLRIQRERQRQQFFPSIREYSQRYGLSRQRSEALPGHALVMHPGPMNRGVEIASDVADLPRSLITDQVTNGIAVRMALLYLILGGGTEEREPPA
jgi:aspartate carbamoyltransferase catalytic subunit